MGVGFASMIYLVGSDCNVQGQRECSEGAGAGWSEYNGSKGVHSAYDGSRFLGIEPETADARGRCCRSGEREDRLQHSAVLAHRTENAVARLSGPIDSAAEGRLFGGVQEMRAHLYHTEAV